MSDCVPKLVFFNSSIGAHCFIHFLCFYSALQHAGKHMEDSIVASYTALLLGCLCQGSQVRRRQYHYITYFLFLCAHLCIHPALCCPSGKRDYCERASAKRGFLHHDGNAEEVLEFHEPHCEYEWRDQTCAFNADKRSGH